MLGNKSNHPGLLDPFAIDSIGKYLDPTHPEVCRMQLMGDPRGENAPNARLIRRVYSTMFVESMHELDDAEQMLCVPIRGSEEVARKLQGNERLPTVVLVEFANGATLTLKQQLVGPLAVTCTIESVQRETKVMYGKLEPAHGAAVNNLFSIAASPAAAAEAARAHAEAEPVFAKHVKHTFEEFHELPVWLTEHMRALGQDLYRLHALSTAAVGQGMRRQFYLDVAKVRHLTDAKRYRKLRSVVTGVMHKASGSCLCHAHQSENVKSNTNPRSMEFSISICGHAFVTHEGRLCCPRHSQCEPLGSKAFPGICARDLHVDIKCLHEKSPKQTSSTDHIGLSLSLPTEKWADALRDFACCACTLSPAHTEVSEPDAKNIRATMDAVMVALATQRFTQGHNDAKLAERDPEAVWLLRDGSVTYNEKEGKMKGKRLTMENREIADTHGFLFKRTRS